MLKLASPLFVVGIYCYHIFKSLNLHPKLRTCCYSKASPNNCFFSCENVLPKIYFALVCACYCSARASQLYMKIHFDTLEHPSFILHAFCKIGENWRENGWRCNQLWFLSKYIVQHSQTTCQLPPFEYTTFATCDFSYCSSNILIL